MILGTKWWCRSSLRAAVLLLLIDLRVGNNSPDEASMHEHTPTSRKRAHDHRSPHSKFTHRVQSIRLFTISNSALYDDELKNDDRFRKMKHDRKNKRKLFVKLCFALKDCLRAIYRMVKERIIRDHRRVSTGCISETVISRIQGFSFDLTL